MKKLFLSLIVPICVCTLFGCNKGDKEVTILFTTDVHGAIDTNSDPKYSKTLTYATAGEIKKELKEEGKEVLLLDSGDHLSGGFYTTYDNGRSIVNLMNMAGYDASTLGNHEFDYNFSYLSDLMKQANFPYISTNFYHMIDKEPTTRFTDLGSKIFNLNNGLRIGVIGVSTPESISTSTPSNFQDEKGNFIYTFRESDLYDVVQKEIDSIKDKTDYIVCLSHLGDQFQTKEFTSTKLANNTSGIDVILDGHTHQLVEENRVKDKNNHEVVISQASSNFKYIGKLKISQRDGIKTEMINSYDKYDEEVRDNETSIIKSLEEKFSTKIAKSDIKFERGDEGKPHETNIGDLVAESPYYFYNVTLPQYGIATSCDASFVNSGGIRAEVINEGTWTLKTCYEIHSFSNSLALIEIEGKYIKDVLEESLQEYPGYYGGFQQVCGIKFNVDSTKEVGSRISDVKIYDRTSDEYKDLVLDKKYLVGGSSYVLIEGGDNIKSFKNASKVIRVDGNITDNITLGSYIYSFKKETGEELATIKNENSPLCTIYPNLKINYTDAGFGERINFVA